MTSTTSNISIENLVKLWEKYQNETGYRNGLCTLVISETYALQLANSIKVSEWYSFWKMLGQDVSLDSLFERRGLPKTLVVKTPNVLEFVKTRHNF